MDATDAMLNSEEIEVMEAREGSERRRRRGVVGASEGPASAEGEGS